MAIKTLFLKYTTADGATLTVEEDDKGFYMTDLAVGWDQVLFGEKSHVTRDDVRGYARNTVSGHPLPFDLAYDADGQAVAA
jgi:hypothetical protein